MRYRITRFRTVGERLNGDYQQRLFRLEEEENRWWFFSRDGFVNWSPSSPNIASPIEFDSLEAVLEYKDLGVDLRSRIIKHLL